MLPFPISEPPEFECKPVGVRKNIFREVTNEQTRILGDNGGCRGREHKSGLCGFRRATWPDRRANNGITAPAARSAFRRPLSGRSPGVDEEAEGFVWADGFPAFAGTMAVERVATGFRWAEGPVYFPAGRYVLFSDIPTTASCASRKMTVISVSIASRR